MNRRISALLLVAILAVVFVSGCAKKEIVRCTTPGDNPQHHYLMGMKALEDGRLDVAEGRFGRAIYCDKKFPPAHSGLAIVKAKKAKKQPDVSFQKVETKRAMDYLKKAKRLSKTDEDRFDYLIATIRVYTALKLKDWLEKAEDAFNKGRKLKVDERRLIYYQGKEAINYFMGLAYLEALEFQKARDSFADVLNAKRKGKWHEKADRAWKRQTKLSVQWQE